jgi:hypothetical protein
MEKEVPTIKLLQKRDRMEHEVLIARHQYKLLQERFGYAKSAEEDKMKQLKDFLSVNNMESNRIILT